MITEGNHIFYTIQHKLVAETPWLKNDMPFKNVERDNIWSFSNWDTFGSIAEPYKFCSNGLEAKYPNSYKEIYEVWSKTGWKGWYTKKFAVRSLKRLEKASEAGKFDYRDTYGTLHQRCRYKFRIVQITMSYKEKVVE